MVNLFIIIGDDNSRKSSTIRALTGAFRSKRYDIQIKDKGVLDFYIQISALQEAHKLANKLIADIKEYGCHNVILPLRIDPVNYNGLKYPNAEQYIDQLLKEKWAIKTVLFIKERFNDQLRRRFSNYADKVINDTEKTPSNKLASILRREWNWI